MTVLKLSDTTAYRVTLQFLSIPVLIIGLVNVIKKWYGIQLIPMGEDFLLNYRLIVHYIVDALYFVPNVYLGIDLDPLWKDVATISIAISTINWKTYATLDKIGGGGGTDDEDFYKLRGIARGLGDGIGYFLYHGRVALSSAGLFTVLIGIFDLVFVFVETLLYSISWFVAALIMTVFGNQGIASKSYETFYVVARGLTMVGLYLPLRHLLNVIRAEKLGDDRVAQVMKQTAGTFFMYLTVVSISVFVFFGTMGAGGFNFLA